MALLMKLSPILGSHMVQKYGESMELAYMSSSPWKIYGISHRLTKSWQRYELCQSVSKPNKYVFTGISLSGASSVNTSLLDTHLTSRTQVIRGRVRDESKPQTFNQLWSSDEQRRLEELLLVHPPEDVEQRRWEKIATALGNRSAQQVRHIYGPATTKCDEMESQTSQMCVGGCTFESHIFVRHVDF